MKFKKMTSALLEAVLLGTTALTGCGSGNDSVAEDGRKNLKVFLYLNDHESEIYKEMINKFQEEHSDTIANIDLQITTQDEYETTLTGMMTAGDMPDVFYVGPNAVEQYVENGYIENLTPYLEEMNISTDGLMQNIVDSYRYDGEKNRLWRCLRST